MWDKKESFERKIKIGVLDFFYSSVVCCGVDRPQNFNTDSNLIWLSNIFFVKTRTFSKQKIKKKYVQIEYTVKERRVLRMTRMSTAVYIQLLVITGISCYKSIHTSSCSFCHRPRISAHKLIDCI